MIAWARTPDGWALNLDGTDAAAVFSLPRLELRSSPQGWVCGCLLPDATSTRSAEPVATVQAAKSAALLLARSALGPSHAAALRELLGPAAA